MSDEEQFYNESDAWIATTDMVEVTIPSPRKKKIPPPSLPQTKRRIRWLWWGLIICSISALPCIYLLNFTNSNKLGTDMNPTLKSGQLLIFKKDLSTLKRGDIIIFDAPPAPGSRFVKRVIGLAGEKVEVRNGVTFINQKPLTEPYVSFSDQGNAPAILVPPNFVYVMGDNRPGSYDSRSWGPLSMKYIEGILFFPEVR